MTTVQVAALKKFLANNNFEYCGYDNELGVVLYKFTLSDWNLEVAYGDECYYRLYNEATEEAKCQELTKVSEVMFEYGKLCSLIYG